MNRLIVAACLLIFTIGWGENKELYTHTYVVPPNFLREAAIDGKHSELSALEVLESNGVTFGEGASATYRKASSQLIVRNTSDQLALVEQLIEAVRDQGSYQVHLRFYEASFEEKLLSDAGKGITDLFGTGIDIDHRTRKIETRADLVEEMRRVPEFVSSKNPGVVSGIRGVFTQPQFDVIIAMLQKAADIKFRELPSVMVRSGRPALVQFENQRYGVIPTVSGDKATIELEAFLPPHGRPLLGAEEKGESFSVTMWDDQIVAWQETDENGPDRLVFIHPLVVDAAGFPYNGKRNQKTIIEPEIEATNLPREESPEGNTLVPAPQAQSPQSPRLQQDEVERVYAADQAALEGIRRMEQEDYDKAIEAFARAKILLPDHPVTEKRRDAYTKQFERARDLQIERASRPVDSHLVTAGESLYQIARKYGLSVARLKEANRLDSDTVKVGQILLIPEKRLQGNLFPKSTLEETLDEIVIREVNLQNASLENALAKFRQYLIDYENPMLPEIDAQLVLKEAESIRDVKITLRLTNVPAAEVIRYITDLAQCSFRVSGDEIVVSPAK